MSVNWHNLAIAVSCSLEHERLCERGSFIDEAALVRASAAFIQSTTQILLAPELPHPDLQGNQRLDLAGRKTPDANLSFLAEAKWIRSGGGVRNWPAEIAKDILRLERLEEDTNGVTERVLIIGGVRRSVRANLLEVETNIGGGRIAVAPHILQLRDAEDRSYPYNQARIGIRDCERQLRSFWRQRAEAFDGQAPVSYQCSLAGHHKAGPTQDAVDVHIWLVRRSRNRAAFSARDEFANA